LSKLAVMAIYHIARPNARKSAIIVARSTCLGGAPMLYLQGACRHQRLSWLRLFLIMMCKN
jgi:hypothetical protein